MCFIKWCNENAGFLTALFALLSFLATAIYVIATIKILNSNQKSAKMAEKQIDESRKALKKSIEIQLYDKRLEIANNFGDNDYSNSTMEISLLFGSSVNSLVEELRTLIGQQSHWKSKNDSYWKAVHEQGMYDDELEYCSSLPNATEKVLQEAKKMSERCKIISSNYCDDEGNEIYYDYGKISENLNDINNKLKEKQRELKRKVWFILKDMTEIEQEVTNEK